jgi:ubiquinone/menaquinone biosynthesis C-methylase UbiE
VRETDSKQAEKAYLSRTGRSDWERAKPFPSGDDDSFFESIELLSDFVVAMKLLQPSADDRILDLGAGGGWCSDLLQRLQRTPVAIDISLDMMRVARTRASRRPIASVAGDLEHLPFADGAFDKAVCLSAMHHVPDIPSAIAEIFRVLAPEGVAVFSEPGVGHASKPWSVTASHDFGVLEQEIHIEPFIATCEAAGFPHVYVCPISYVIPEFELTKGEWRSWQRLPRTKRPWRAMEKMSRAMIEMVGGGKESILFEEAFAMRLVRLLQVPVEEHPFIIAAKSAERRRNRSKYSAVIKIDSLPAEVPVSGQVHGRITLTNHGSSTWQARNDSNTGQVRLGVQLLDRDGHLVVRDFARCELPHDVPPGGSAAVEVVFHAPDDAELFRIKFDLVAEGVCWFEPSGTQAPSRPLLVRS